MKYLPEGDEEDNFRGPWEPDLIRLEADLCIWASEWQMRVTKGRDKTERCKFHLGLNLTK